ncbi:MAG: prepilin-type N-terminal cleavage/methylation domain-containing protein [Deltaproteobacteria bacterium]|nr:prepilin-type N-terminal cleavage/methylation domain-containing protein [Deltaproteobacteria bacterium]
MKRLFGPKGFTLLELLVAIGILGILVALAIPQYNAYRRKTFIATVKSDLKNASIVQEAYYAEFEVYTAALPTLLAHGFRQSNGVSLTITSDGTTYSLAATHANCGADTWTYNESGNIVDPPSPCQ